MTAWLCVTFFGTVLELQCFKLVLLPYKQTSCAARVRAVGMEDPAERLRRAEFGRRRNICRQLYRIRKRGGTA